MPAQTIKASNFAGLEKANLTIEQQNEKAEIELIIADYRALTAQ